MFAQRMALNRKETCYTSWKDFATMPENLNTDQRLRGPKVVSLADAERHSEVQLHSELSVWIRDAVVGSFCEIGHQVV